MRKTLFSLLFAIGTVPAFAGLPYTDMDFRPNPLVKPIDYVRAKNSFEKHVEMLSKLTGIEIIIDIDGLQKHGVSKNTSFEMIFLNCQIIDLVYIMVERVDQNENLMVVLNEDGSLTITGK
jgi:hypothetical protein